MPTKPSPTAQRASQNTSAQRAHAPPPPPTPSPPTSLFSSPSHLLAKFKQRSHSTHHSIHLPELNARLNLDLDLPTPRTQCQWGRPDLTNTRPIWLVYLGNSMLERLKSIGLSTRLRLLCRKGCTWNAGVGRDKNECFVPSGSGAAERVLSVPLHQHYVQRHQRRHEHS
jgi:hypothetical protein